MQTDNHTVYVLGNNKTVRKVGTSKGDMQLLQMN